MLVSRSFLNVQSLCALPSLHPKPIFRAGGGACADCGFRHRPSPVLRFAACLPLPAKSAGRGTLENTSSPTRGLDQNYVRDVAVLAAEVMSSRLDDDLECAAVEDVAERVL